MTQQLYTITLDPPNYQQVFDEVFEQVRRWGFKETRKNLDFLEYQRRIIYGIKVDKVDTTLYLWFSETDRQIKVEFRYERKYRQPLNKRLTQSKPKLSK